MYMDQNYVIFNIPFSDRILTMNNYLLYFECIVVVSLSSLSSLN